MVATRRSRGLEVKEEALPCKVDDQPSRNKSVEKNAATEDIEVQHSARLRESSPSPCVSSRRKRANRSLDSNFQWEPPKHARRSVEKVIKTKTREPSLRRSLRHRNSSFANLAEKYIEYNGPSLRDNLRRQRARDKEIARGSEGRERRRRELSDLLAAQGKNLSDVKLYTEPDIYSSVKSRVRVSTRDRLYEQYFTQGMSKKKPPEVEEESQSEETEEDEDEDDQTNEEEEEDDDDDEGEEGHPYKLRKVREAPKRYMIVREVQRRRPRSLFEDLPCSPARRRRRHPPGTPRPVPFHTRRRRARTQGNSSTSDDSSSDDEMKFRKRQHKSMARARNECMPINVSSGDLKKHSYARERKKIGQSLADIDPMGLDTSVTFCSVGGHNKHIRSLKEMVVFPLLYPEVFDKFSITPPRGCLFHGPPGTGKTLMARALANECSTDGKKVSFFMKKGADCLSKWIGESERQLRVLFDQAYQMRPSIIFFDEIDGLAPVRSSRQDQIHSSIVSTLLALMDGLDNRGEIIVIGATNRIDSIDPALRRPGRFDREFLFPLPDKQAREEILRIHTKAWNPQLKQFFVEHLASKTVGYCGADMKALCTEAALIALRRRYPQIYESSEKLQLDVNNISIQSTDFHAAIKTIIPTAQRSTSSPGRALPTAIVPLLGDSLRKAVFQLLQLFPVLKNKSKLIQASDVAPDERQPNREDSDNEYDYDVRGQAGGIYVGESDFDERANPILQLLSGNNNGIVQSRYTTLLNRLISRDQSLNTIHRPRFIVCGESVAVNGHVTSALLHDMEGLPVHCLDLPTLYGISARTPEESCSQVFRQARRLTPSVIFLPNALQWWLVASPTVQATLESLLQDIPSSSPILFVASANCSYRQLPREFAKFFHSDFDEVLELEIKFTSEQRREFFAPIFLIYSVIPPPRSSRAAPLEYLPKAPAVEPAPLTKEEEERLVKEEESTLRNLRLFLRDALMRLERDRRFKIFSKPVDYEEVPDYMEVIKYPMDFSTMQTRIDKHEYQTAEMFLDDIDLICNNALEYNPDRRPEDKLIRHRACAMRDMAHAIVDTDLEPEFDKLCHEVVESRKRRGTAINKFAPKFYPVLPEHLMVHPITGEVTQRSDLQHPNGSLENSQAEQAVEKTPWKAHGKRPQSTTKGRRKRSSWSRGILSSVKKKRKVTQSSEDEEEIIEDSSMNSIEGADDDVSEASENQRLLDEEDDQRHEEKEVDNTLTCEDEKDEEKVNLTVIFENGTGTEMQIEIDQDSGKDSLPQQEENVNNNEKTAVVTNANDLNHVSQEEEIESGDVEEGAKSQEAPFIENEVQNVEVEETPHNGQFIEKEEVSSPPKKMTLRSKRRSTSGIQPELGKFVEPPPPLLVDHKSLINLLEDVVMITESCAIDELERIQASLSRCVAKYRLKYDRTSLTQDLKKEIDSITRLKKVCLRP